MDLDLLAIAPHPDDAELWCGGYLAKAAREGYKVGVVDLSKGELSSNGTVQQRERETKSASQILKLAYRSNCKLPDGGISGTDEKQLRAVVKVLRELKPRMVLAPYHVERHPDHEAASQLTQRAIFFAGLRNFLPKSGKPHTVSSLVFYQIRVEFQPSFLVDISADFETKVRAIQAYNSQMESAAKVKTLLNSPMTLRAIEARDAHNGAKLGVKYAEAYLSRAAVGLSDPIETLCTAERPQFFTL
jgi:bacillithiol biosynthesis deacetylase BshB1